MSKVDEYVPCIMPDVDSEWYRKTKKIAERNYSKMSENLVMSYEDYCQESKNILDNSSRTVNAGGTSSKATASGVSLQGLRAFKLKNSTTAEFHILSKLPESSKVPPAPFESDVSAQIVYRYCQMISSTPTYTSVNKQDIQDFLSTLPARPAETKSGFTLEESQKFQNDHPEPNGCALERVLNLSQRLIDLKLRPSPEMYDQFSPSLGEADKVTVESLPTEEFMTTIRNPKNVGEAGTSSFYSHDIG